MKTNQVPEVWSECFSQLLERAASCGSLNVGKICSMESQAICQKKYVQWKADCWKSTNQAQPFPLAWPRLGSRPRHDLLQP